MKVSVTLRCKCVTYYLGVVLYTFAVTWYIWKLFRQRR